MQEHPIPRQITTFEFKLIGELTIKQFGYLALAAAGSVLLFFLVPKILYLNYLAAIIPALFGIGFAFVPINERPMDLWLRNLFKRLFTATQYYYHKANSPPKILLGLQLPPREVLLQHIKAQQSLNEYLQKKPKTGGADNIAQLDSDLDKKKQRLQELMASTTASVNTPIKVRESVKQVMEPGYSPVKTLEKTAAVQIEAEQNQPVKNFSGTVMTTNGLPIANQMVYVKKGEETVRLFKTNSQGHFENNLPLSQGDYFLEVVDPQKKHTFARMKVDNNVRDVQILANHEQKTNRTNQINDTGVY